MDLQIIIILCLNFVVALIGTLSYAVRLVGVRTGKLAVSLAAFNVLALVSRIAVTFQMPLLTKLVEQSMNINELTKMFYALILITAMASIIGAFFIPTFQRAFCKVVVSFSTEKSAARLILHSFSKTGIRQFKNCISIPKRANITKRNYKQIPKRIFVFNLLSVSLLTIGSFAPILAGGFEPSLRATCITLSSVLNGLATIFLTVFIDPQLSIMTDNLIEGKCLEEDFRTCVVGMVGTKILGTFASLLLLVPGAHFIAFIARII